MRTPNSNLATPLIERAEMTVVHNQPKRKYNRKMIRFIVKDMNNRPISFASVKLNSENGSTALKYDNDSGTFIARRFEYGLYKLEVTAENFVSRTIELYVPKTGLQRLIMMAK